MLAAPGGGAENTARRDSGSTPPMGLKSRAPVLGSHGMRPASTASAAPPTRGALGLMTTPAWIRVPLKDTAPRAPPPPVPTPRLP